MYAFLVVVVALAVVAFCIGAIKPVFFETTRKAALLSAGTVFVLAVGAMYLVGQPAPQPPPSGAAARPTLAIPASGGGLPAFQLSGYVDPTRGINSCSMGLYVSHNLTQPLDWFSGALAMDSSSEVGILTTVGRFHFSDVEPGRRARATIHFDGHCDAHTRFRFMRVDTCRVAGRTITGCGDYVTGTYRPWGSAEDLDIRQ